MNRADLKGWFEYLKSLGLTVLLGSRDGRRVFRYLVDLAHQTHICAILLYMAVFDHLRRDLHRLLTPSEYLKVNERVRKSRNKFAHGNTLDEDDYLGKMDFEFVASLISTYKHKIIDPLIMSSQNDLALSPLLDRVDDRCFLSVGAMNQRDLREWYQHLKQLGLCGLRDYRDGRRLLRYLVDLAYQYHICTILIYMSLFDTFDKASMRQILSASEYQRVDQKLRKSRHKFAHGKPFTAQDYLDRDDFEFVASLFRQHKNVLIQHAAQKHPFPQTGPNLGKKKHSIRGKRRGRGRQSRGSSGLGSNDAPHESTE